MAEFAPSVSRYQKNDIFISYTPSDVEFARNLFAAIVRQNRDPWIDWHDIPFECQSEAERQEHIKVGIREADLFVFLLSPDSLSATQNQLELNLAIEYGKRVLQIECKPSNTLDMPTVLREASTILFETNAIDLSEKSTTEQFDKLTKLILHIQIDTKLLERAHTWELSKDSDLLLHERDLWAVEQWREQSKREPFKSILNYQLNPVQEAFIKESKSFIGKAKAVEVELDIFISYSRKDKEFVKRLYDALKSSPISQKIWIDWDNIPIASNWWKEIEQGIENSRVFLFVSSLKSVHSEYCHKEIKHAVQNNKRLIPIRLERIDSTISNTLRDEHPEYASLMAHQGLEYYQDQDFDQLLEKLVDAIKRNLENDKLHRKLLIKAIDWEGDKHSEEMLLRRRELERYMQVEAWRSQCTSSAKSSRTTLSLISPVLNQSNNSEKEHLKLTDLQIRYIRGSKKAIANHRRIRRLQGLAGVLAVLGLGTLSWFFLNSRVGQINTLVSSLEDSRGLDDLVIAIAAGEKMQNTPVPKQLVDVINPNLQSQVVTALNKEVYNLREINRLEKHKSQVFNAVFSPDDTLIASASEDKSVGIWQSNGVLAQKLAGHRDAVTRVDFDPGFDAKHKLLASGSRDGAVIVWSLNTTRNSTDAIPTLEGGAQFLKDPPTDIINCLQFSPGGQRLASASRDGTIKLWTRRPNSNVGDTFPNQPITLRAHQGAIYWVAFNPTGDRLISAGADGTVKIWSKSNNFTTPQASLQQGSPALYTLFSPDGTLIASSGFDGTVKLWKIDGTPIASMKKHEGIVYQLAFSPDSQMLASASEDGTVRLWDRKGKLLATLRGHKEPVYRVQFSPNGKVVATTGSDGMIKLWITANNGADQAFGQELDTLEGHKDAVNSIQFSTDGGRLLSASADKTIRIWTLEKLRRILPHNNRVNDVVFHPEGKVIASSSVRSVRLWSFLDGTPLDILSDAHDGNVLSIRFNPQGNLLASAGEDGLVKLWNVNVNRQRQEFYGQSRKILKGHQGEVSSLSFSADGQFLASGSEDATVKIWSSQGRLLTTLRHQSAVSGVSFGSLPLPNAPAGSFLLASATRSTDATSELILWKLTLKAGGKLEAQRIKTINETTEPQWHKGGVLSLTFNPQGNLLATSGQDGTVKLWNPDGTFVRSLGNSEDAPVVSTSFSADGKLLALAQDRIIRVWTVEGVFLNGLIRHKREISSVSFSPSNDVLVPRSLASASHDNDVLLWSMPRDFDKRVLNELLAQGCNLVHEYLTTPNTSSDVTEIKRNESEATEIEKNEVENFCEFAPKTEAPVLQHIEEGSDH